MSHLDRPILGPQIDEDLEVGLHEIDLIFWDQLRELLELTPGAERAFSLFQGRLQRPKRPVKLSNLLHSYAQALFRKEASTYPQDSTQLHHWLSKLAERIEARVMQRVREVNASQRGLQTLAHHGVAEAEMRHTVSEAVKEAIAAHVQPRQPTPSAGQAEPKHEKEDSAPSKNGETERRRNLLAEYKAATNNPSNKRIYEARNSAIYKPQFYQWLHGTLTADSATAKNFERFLKEKKPPISRRQQD